MIFDEILVNIDWVTVAANFREFLHGVDGLALENEKDRPGMVNFLLIPLGWTVLENISVRIWAQGESKTAVNMEIIDDELKDISENDEGLGAAKKVNDWFLSLGENIIFDLPAIRPDKDDPLDKWFEFYALDGNILLKEIAKIKELSYGYIRKRHQIFSDQHPEYKRKRNKKGT